MAVAHTHSVSAPPLRAIETRAVPSRLATAGGKRPRLERKYSKIVDQYRSLEEVCMNCVMFPSRCSDDQMLKSKGMNIV